MKYRKPRSSCRQPRTRQPRRGQQPIIRRGRQPIIRRGRALIGWQIYLATGKRVPYRVAGNAHRQASTAATKAAKTGKLSKFDLLVLMAVQALVVSYSRTEDNVAVVQIAAFVYQVDVDDVKGWQRNEVTRSLRHLDDVGALTYKPGRGRGAVPTIGFDAPAETGKSRSQSPAFPDRNAGETSEKSRANEREKQETTARSPAQTRYTEKTSEKTSEKNFGEISEPESSRDSSGDAFTPERADQERNEEEAWYANAPADVQPFFAVVASYTYGRVRLNPEDKKLVDAIRDAMKRRGCSARHLAGSLEPGAWPAEFRQSAEAFVMSKLSS